MQKEVGANPPPNESPQEDPQVTRQRAAEARFRGVFDNAPFGVLVIDPADGRFVEFNTAAHHQFGYTREELTALRLADIEAAESPGDFRSHVERVLSQGADCFE